MWTAVRTELNWYQYRTLMAIDDEDKREYYLPAEYGLVSVAHPEAESLAVH